MARILDGITVLDLTRIVAGPWCTQILADMGATVWKIERPGEGDDTRRMGPAILDAEGRRTDETAMFLACNRGKQSITVDLATPEGSAIVRGLAGKCDVFIENYKAGGLAKYGLDEPSIRDLNDRVVYCSVTGFGVDGPYASRPAYDFILQGMSGLMSTCGDPDGPPTRTAIPITDIATGLYASSAILGALFHRERTGEGQFIDASLLDCSVALVSQFAASFFLTGTSPTRAGNNNPIAAPANVFRTSDGYINLACGNQGQFTKLAAALSIPELLADARYATNADRIVHRDALHAAIGERTKLLTTAEAVAALLAADIPCGPINEIGDVFSDVQVRHRELAVSVPHASGREVRLVRNPIRFSKTPIDIRHPPLMGEHTSQVLRSELGMSEQSMSILRDKRVI